MRHYGRFHLRQPIVIIRRYEKTDIDVDGVRLPRARTHFFR